MEPNLQTPSLKRFARCLVLLGLLVPLMFWHHAIATIPTPLAVQLDPESLRWNGQWEMNLKTGRVQETIGPDEVVYQDNKRFEFNILQDEEKLDVAVYALSSGEPLQHATVSLWGFPTVLSGRYLINEQGMQIRAVDLEALDEGFYVESIVPGSFAEIVGVPGTNRFLRNDQRALNRNKQLFQIDRDELRLVSSWPGSGMVSYSDGFFYSCVSLERRIEVHSATDGALVESIPFPDAPDIASNLYFELISEEILSMADEDSTRFLSFDLQRKKRLNVPGPDYRAERFPESRYVILASQQLGKQNERLVYDRDSDKVIQRLDSPISADQFQVLDDTHGAFIGRAHGVSAVVMDMTTGREVKRYVPFAWLSRSALLFYPLMLLWFILWCRTSAQAHDWAWLDILLLAGVLVFISSYRFDDAWFNDVTNFVISFALIASVIQCSFWWLTLSKQKLVGRLSVFLLTLGCAQLAYHRLITWHMVYPFRGLGYATAVSFTSISVASILLRCFGRTVGRASETHERVSVRDLMFLTVASAVFVSSLKQSVELFNATGAIEDFTPYLIVPFMLSPIGFAIGFSPNRRQFVTALGVTAFAVSLVASCRTFELWSGISLARLGEMMFYPTTPIMQANSAEDIFDTHRQIEAMLTALCAPFLATIPLRLRGWHLAKNGVRSHLAELRPLDT